MREWILDQGISLYVFFSVGLLGFIATAAANRTYKRLIREADHMEKSEHRLIKYIKLKYSSYYSIGLKTNDEKAMVKRYLYRYKIGAVPLISLSKAGLAAMTVVILTAAATMLYRLNQGSMLSDLSPLFGICAFLVTILAMQYKICSFQDKRDTFCAQMEDNLENFLKNKIEYGHVLEEQRAQMHTDNSDQDNRRGVKKDSFEDQNSNHEKDEATRNRTVYHSGGAKDQAAASAVENSLLKRQKAAESVFGNVASNLADGFSSDKIDAKVVEDILKEFLN